MTLLDQKFVDSYSQKTAPWGFSGLGEIVFLRTYSRKKDNGETETWPETIQRVIDGAYAIGVPYTKKEAEKLSIIIKGLESKLSNKGFTDNAPADVVEKQKI